MNRLALPTLDHVAIAVRSIESPRLFLEEDLGSHPVGGGDAPGFRSYQWCFANGMKLELLEPFRQTESDFLERFVETIGPGAHHLTFRVSHIHQAAEAARQAGFPILYLRDSEPSWKEAFIHPRDAAGVLVQLAEFPNQDDSATGSGYALDRVDVAVADLVQARALYEGVLGGSTSASGTAESVTLAWPGTGSVRLVLAGEGEPRGIRGLTFTHGKCSAPALVLREDLGVEIQLS